MMLVWRGPLLHAAIVAQDERVRFELYFYGVTFKRWGFGIVLRRAKEVRHGE